MKTKAICKYNLVKGYLPESLLADFAAEKLSGIGLSVVLGRAVAKRYCDICREYPGGFFIEEVELGVDSEEAYKLIHYSINHFAAFMKWILCRRSGKRTRMKFGRLSRKQYFEMPRDYISKIAKIISISQEDWDNSAELWLNTKSGVEIYLRDPITFNSQSNSITAKEN